MRFFQFRKLINYIADPKTFTKGTTTAPTQEELQEEYKRFMKEDLEFMEQSKKKTKKSVWPKQTPPGTKGTGK